MDAEPDCFGRKRSERDYLHRGGRLRFALQRRSGRVLERGGLQRVTFRLLFNS